MKFDINTWTVVWSTISGNKYSYPRNAGCRECKEKNYEHCISRDTGAYKKNGLRSGCLCG